jgi:hypothetical protein
MHPYENGEINSKFGFSVDFKNQLELLCKKIKHYIDDEQYRESQPAHKLVDGMFELNGEFYNLYNSLEQSESPERLNRVKSLWISVYSFLIQLVTKELDVLLIKQDEETFKNKLERSYI